jgi:hypothetical protein
MYREETIHSKAGADYFRDYFLYRPIASALQYATIIKPEIISYIGLSQAHSLLTLIGRLFNMAPTLLQCPINLSVKLQVGIEPSTSLSLHSLAPTTKPTLYPLIVHQLFTAKTVIRSNSNCLVTVQ